MKASWWKECNIVNQTHQDGGPDPPPSVSPKVSATDEIAFTPFSLFREQLKSLCQLLSTELVQSPFLLIFNVQSHS